MRKNSEITIIIVFITLVLFGLISFFYMDYTIIPEIEYPELIIITSYPNTSSDEIDTIVTRPIEEISSSLKGVKRTKSISKDGISIVRLEYDWKTNLTEAHIELRDKIDQITPFFPKEVNRPIILTYQSSMDALCAIIVKSSINPRDLYLIINKDIRSFFEKIDGVSRIMIQGGEKPEIQIILDQEALDKYGLNFEELKNCIQNSNKDFPVGFYEEQDKEYQLRVKGRFNNFKDFENIIIKNEKERIVRLADCSKIIYTSKDKHDGVLLNGKEEMLILLYKQPGQNVVKLSKKIKNGLTILNERYKGEIQFNYVFDESDYIKKAIQDLLITIIFGIFCTIISIFLFLYNKNLCLIVTVTIPISIISSFIIMRIFKISINLLSLGGISLSIGMIVDNSVIVIEEVLEYLKKKEKSLDYYHSVKKVSPAVISSTLTTLVVFLPIFFLEGILKVVFMQLVIVIFFSLLFSMFTALFLIPILLKNVEISKKEYFLINQVNRFIYKTFDNIYKIIFSQQLLFLIIVLLFLIGGFLSFFIIPKTFIESMPSNTFYIKLFIRKQVPYTYTKSFISLVEQIIESSRGIKSYISYIGVNSEDLLANIEGIYGENTAIIKIITSNYGNVVYKIIKNLKKQFQQFDDVNFIFIIPDNPVQRLITRSEYNSIIKIYSDDFNQLLTKTEQLSEEIKNQNLADDVINSYYLKIYEKEVLINRDSISRYFLDASSIAEFLAAYTGGYNVSNWKKDEYEIPVLLKIGDTKNFPKEEILAKTISNKKGLRIYLKDLLSISDKESSYQIMKENQRKYAWIGFNQKGKDKNIINVIKNKNAEKLEYKYESQFSVLGDNLKEILLALFMSIFLEYAILAIQFQSFSKPILVMLMIPISICGMFFILFITGNSLNINTFMSIIVLIGLLVNNGIMLFYDYDNEKANDKEKIIELTLKRLPAIFITQLSTIIALIPTFFSNNKIQIALSLNLIFGLIFSTGVTILSLPLFYFYKKNGFKRTIKFQKS